MISAASIADKECPMPACSHSDTLADLLTCPGIRDRMEDTDAPVTVTYDDVFSKDINCLRRQMVQCSLLLTAYMDRLSPPLIKLRDK